MTFDTKPSPASGVSCDDLATRYSESNNPNLSVKKAYNVAWLLERRRTKVSTKWSGTNQHPTYHNNKLGNIINVFAHYSHWYTGGQVVLGDIQSVYSTCLFLFYMLTVTNQASAYSGKNILFDVMTHTSGQYVNLLTLRSITYTHL